MLGRLSRTSLTRGQLSSTRSAIWFRVCCSEYEYVSAKASSMFLRTFLYAWSQSYPGSSAASAECAQRAVTLVARMRSYASLSVVYLSLM